ncbi:MAG: class I SAM-dependent methyltransferase [Pyrinomonadaceae bacterium]
MPNSVERFTNRVRNYVKYRPGYPPEILQLFRNEMNLQPSSVIADVGSGTGISAKIFVENGNTVFGVEPNAAMREAAENFLREFPNFKSVSGTSEKTTLEDDSVDFAIAAQAFHWFNPNRTRAEFKRILKDKGFVVLMWNERRLDATDFLRDYEDFLNRFATDYAQVRHENVSAQIIGDFFRTDFRRATFPMSQEFDFDGLKGRLLSSSYAPTAENPLYEPMIEELKRLFTKYQKDGRIHIFYDTNIYYGQI